MRSAVGGWLFWLVVALGLFDAGLPRERFLGVQQRFGAGQWPGLVDAVRAYVTNDGDVRRYYAYVQASRGRPYQSYFVRTAEDWRRAFAAAEPYRPDAWPTVTPERPLVPYRDYLIEYPPGFFAVAVPPAWLAADADGYVKWFVAMMALALTGAFALGARAVSLARGRAGAAIGPVMGWAALGVLLLGIVATHRYDAAVALSLALAAWAAVAYRPVILGIAVGVAIALKLTPLMVVPLFAMLGVRERRWRDLSLSAAAAVVAIVALTRWSLASSGGHLIDMLRYHADRPLQIESTWGALFGLIHAVAPGVAQVEKTFGSTNVAGALGHTASQVSTLATIAGLLAVYVVTWRRLAAPAAADRARAVLAATVAVFAVFITCSKLSSPQYLVWILPVGLALSLAEGDRRELASLLAVLTLAQLVYPISYARLEALRPGACALVLARNVTLIVWTVRLLARRPEPARDARAAPLTAELAPAARDSTLT
ncbi:MAG TPA: glycosyltransferase 87 family protein [Polyangia bacterium]|nr:glycosyltransferase 87 family protein [Polyangia bacterium]